jgi:outer membrane receptor protein involved in Fe transport
MASAAHAQEAPATGPAEVVAEEEATTGEIVVTGSRIRRSATDTTAPAIAIGPEQLTDRGFVSAADALNQVTSNAPSRLLAAGDGTSSGSGQQFPNLFGLGPGRTLTLVNGRRTVSSGSGVGSFASGNGDAVVDANIIPTGLIERVEVVQAGGAVVYGSDAIAGVVNYILKDDFQGIELDAQTSITSYGDYPVHSLRGTAGTNFADGRGNIAVNVEWSKSQPLAFRDRPRTNLSRVTQANPADTGPNDGRPSSIEFLNATLWGFNNNGVIFNTPAPVAALLTRVGGSPVQFAPDGTLMPFNPGSNVGIPFAAGGDGFRYSDLAGLRTGVERITGNLLAHYDLTDNIKLSTELLFARTEGTETPQVYSRSVLGAANTAAIPFVRSNPFLSASALAALTAARPSFAAGAPLFLSKSFTDLQQDGRQTTRVDTYRALLALDGEFKLGGRNFYWSVSGSYGRVEGQVSSWGIVNARFNNAINAARNSAGQIVCAINADASAANDDPACAPINPFGAGNVSQAARDYINAQIGQDYVNEQYDLLATLGGSLFRLPGGDVKFSAAYEHRDEQAAFTPFAASQAGSTGVGTPVLPASGSYNTDELSGELLVPLVGGDFRLPLVKSLEVTGAYRHVDNSIAGPEDLWSVGARWEVVDGLAFRASKSRNFRAPTLTQLFSPAQTGLAAIQSDSCDRQRINAGPNPARRRANCLALFEANPNYGVGGTTGLPAGSSAADRLAAFEDPAENSPITAITTQGNPNLKNEVSKTLTYGVVLQPRFIPGLSITVDRVEVDITNGFSRYQTQNFVDACMDSETPSPDVCGAFSRIPAPSGNNVGGTILTGTTAPFNSGIVRYRGEVYSLNYAFELASLFGGEKLGRLDIGVEATHTALLTSSLTGEVFDRTDNTVAQPDWEGRLDIRYINGPFRFTYQLFYLDKVKANGTATIENNPNPVLDSNVVQSISAQYDLGKLTLRAGVNNLFNEEPSYPSFTYGDIIGRQFFVGARLKF